MTAKNNQEMLVGAAVLFRDYRGKRQYLIVKVREGGDWEIPKVVVRRGESSVRAVIRMVGEQLGISARVLEEVGRGTGVARVNGKTLPQRLFYYLMLQRSKGGKFWGFMILLGLSLIRLTKNLA